MNKSKQTNKRKTKRTYMSRNACNGEKSELLKRIDRPLLIDSLNGAIGFFKTCSEKDKQLQ